MPYDTLSPYSLPAIKPNKVIGAFDRGRLPSDAGVLAPAEIERRLGIAERLSACLDDPRSPNRIRHDFGKKLGIVVRCRSMRVVRTRLALEILLAMPARARRFARSTFGAKNLHRSPGLDECAVHREMLIGQKAIDPCVRGSTSLRRTCRQSRRRAAGPCSR